MEFIQLLTRVALPEIKTPEYYIHSYHCYLIVNDTPNSQPILQITASVYRRTRFIGMRYFSITDRQTIREIRWLKDIIESTEFEVIPDGIELAESNKRQVLSEASKALDNWMAAQQ